MAKRLKYNIPEWFEQETKEWIQIIIRGNRDKLKDIDLGAINILATQYNSYVLATKDIEDNGVTFKNYRGDIIRNPATSIAKDASSQCFNFIKEYGLTLKSRDGIKPEEGNGEDESPLGKFFKSVK
ncbi:phage terminase small subunit P27 family [Parabacteroides sp. Marseille-P3160]|uniref:phage terminase small subunit P27 family n=1 Tax=Parabacteroides sp. Marseille-P3160 TaxID=1917887 RepID=UPI0009BA0B9A|nr:phage terminase small subunit P27 family [Parabacteroides sp. Marseille-P3160]